MGGGGGAPPPLPGSRKGVPLGAAGSAATTASAWGGGGAGQETSLPVYTAGPGGELRPGRVAGEERARAGASWRGLAGLGVAGGRWPVGHSRGWPLDELAGRRSARVVGRGAVGACPLPVRCGGRRALGTLAGRTEARKGLLARARDRGRGGDPEDAGGRGGGLALPRAAPRPAPGSPRSGRRRDGGLWEAGVRRDWLGTWPSRRPAAAGRSART